MTKIIMSLLLIVIASQAIVNAQTKARSESRNSGSSQTPRSVLPEADRTSSSLPPEANETRVTNVEPLPRDAKKYYNEAIKYARIGMYEEAIIALQLTIQLKPDYKDAYYALGDVYSDVGRLTKAIEIYERLLRLFPKDDEAFLSLGETYVRLRAEERSIPLLVKSEGKKNSSVGEKLALNQSPPATARSETNPARSNSQAPITIRSVVSKQSSHAASTTNSAGLNGGSNASRGDARPTQPTPNTPTSKTIPITRESSNATASSEPGPQRTGAGVGDSTTRVAYKPAVLSTKIPNVSKTPAASASEETTRESPASKTSAKDNKRNAIDSDPAKAVASSIGDNEEESGAGAQTTSTSAFETSASPSKPVKTEPTQVYRVGIGDVLDVHVSDVLASQPTLFTVTATGLLEYPVLDRPLQVLGLTTGEISDKLKSNLKRLALSETPEVLVGVREYSSHSILVSGLVKEPGTKILRREAIPLYVVLADAQPFPEAARATVISHETGKPTAMDITDPQATNMLIRSGDVVMVQPSVKQFYYIGGEVKSPGEKPYRPGITLTQAILTSGGLVRKVREAQLARDGENGPLAFSAYKLEDITSGKIPDPVIRPGDRIMIEH